MSQYVHMIRALKTPTAIKRLAELYGSREGMLVEQTARYTRTIKRHEELIGTESPVLMVSAPGRTEIGGNHTDHNKGMVLAAAVNLDALAAVSGRTDATVRIFSEGYAPLDISLEDLEAKKAEEGSSAAIIRGVAFKMKELGYQIGGFDAVVTSTVRGGSGLSSSAAFEVLVCSMFDALYNGWRMEAKERAQISRFAENVYFGKPSGLMDQMASSVGGLTFMDFKEENPHIAGINYNFAQKDMALVVINTGGGHDDLTHDYAAIPQEMRLVAECFGEETLRRVRPEQFMQSIPLIRETLQGQNPERCILRAAHYFTENKRVEAEVNALKHDDLDSFLRLIIESGRSSFTYLQNVFAKPEKQELSLALMLAETKLQGAGAWRVHGGGFAGTTLNFVPQKDVNDFVHSMEAVFGEYCCNVLAIRPEGPAFLSLDE